MVDVDRHIRSNPASSTCACCGPPADSWCQTQRDRRTAGNCKPAARKYRVIPGRPRRPATWPCASSTSFHRARAGGASQSASRAQPHGQEDAARPRADRQAETGAGQDQVEVNAPRRAQREVDKPEATSVEKIGARDGHTPKRPRGATITATMFPKPSNSTAPEIARLPPARGKWSVALFSTATMTRGRNPHSRRWRPRDSRRSPGGQSTARGQTRPAPALAQNRDNISPCRSWRRAAWRASHALGS